MSQGLGHSMRRRRELVASATKDTTMAYDENDEDED